MINNAIISLKQLAGNATLKQQGTAITNIRALILPAGNEILALMGLPIGQSYTFTIISDTLNIQPEDEFTITDKMNSELVNGTKFVVKGDARVNKIMSNRVINGVCVRMDG